MPLAEVSRFIRRVTSKRGIEQTGSRGDDTQSLLEQISPLFFDLNNLDDPSLKNRGVDREKYDTVMRAIYDDGLLPRVLDEKGQPRKFENVDDLLFEAIKLPGIERVSRAPIKHNRHAK